MTIFATNPATLRSTFGKSLLLASVVALSLGSVNLAVAEEAPSNAELYKMLLELKSENEKLKGEVQRLSAKTSSTHASSSSNQASSASPSYQGGSSSSGKMVANEDYSGGKAVFVPAESKFSVGVQVPMLSMTANHGAGGGLGGANLFSEFETQAAYRLLAAYESPSGLGVRGRYFSYESGLPVTGAPDFFALESGELELSTAFSAGGWDLTGSAGVAMADIDWATRFLPGLPFHFEGTGFTVALDAERELGGGFGLVAGARQTMLYGETTPSIGAAVDGVFVPMSELRAGSSYSWSFPRGNSASVEIGYESQTIHALSIRTAAIDPEDVDVSLAGPYFSFKFEF